jgi:hypothetical protein
MKQSDTTCLVHVPSALNVIVVALPLESEHFQLPTNLPASLFPPQAVMPRITSSNIVKENNLIFFVIFLFPFTLRFLSPALLPVVLL